MSDRQTVIWIEAVEVFGDECSTEVVLKEIKVFLHLLLFYQQIENEYRWYIAIIHIVASSYLSFV